MMIIHSLKKFLLKGLSIRKYNIRSESLEIINIVKSKAKISDQAPANNTPSLKLQHSAEKTVYSSQSECS